MRYTRRECIHAVLRRTHRDAERVVRHRRELRRETVDRAAMLHHASTIERADPEADAATARRTCWCKLRFPHAVECRRLNHTAVRSDAASEECADEATEVRHRRVHTPRWRHAECKGRRRKRALVFRPHQRVGHVYAQRRRQLEGA